MSNSASIIDSAKQVMKRINPNLEDKFATLISFLIDNPNSASIVRGKEFGTEEYLTRQAENFVHYREPRAPKPPSTIPDEMVSFIIHKYFDVPEAELKKAVEFHNLCMGAENLIGDILERYIASVVEHRGWVWCSGSTVKSIDFIHRKKNDGWGALQVKNRDNSENSSSSAVRAGTTIEKWFRTYSTRKGDNWKNFPNIVDKVELSEEGFKKFAGEYLLGIKKRAS